MLVTKMDPDDWRRRLAVLSEDIDLSTQAGRDLLHVIVCEASEATTVAALRDLARALGVVGPASSRTAVVENIVEAWAQRDADARLISAQPAASQAARQSGADHARALAVEAYRAVGGPDEASAVEALRAHVEWLAGVTPGLGS